MQQATPEELTAAGIDAAHPFAKSERRIGQPGRWRIGDDLVTRRGSDGGIVHSFGYFTPGQIAYRQAWAKAITAGISELIAPEAVTGH